MNKRHAYLIIAHAHPIALEHLLRLLDDERNDIYLHIDKKSTTLDLPFIKNLIKKSKLTIIEPTDVRWGHVSQIAVELKLFRAAREGGGYAYYHLISGSDMPLKTQDEIHDFFLDNEGMEFLGYSNDQLDVSKVEGYHLFPRNMRVTETQTLKRIGRKLRMMFLSLQQAVGYKYRKSESTFVHGSNWVSITEKLVNELLQLEDAFLDFYKRSNCGDEIYKHSFVYNSDYYLSVFDPNDELRGCMRYMDWQRGRPYTFTEEDFDLLMSQEHLFARKFEDGADTEVMHKIYNQLKSKTL